MKREIDGMYVIIIKTIMLATTKGQTPLIMLSTGLLRVDEATKISRPKGGVIMPMPMLSVTIIPK